MWRCAHTETTTASRERLWEIYARPTEWPSWDHEVLEVTVDGPFAMGTTGTLRPASGPSSKFTLTNVTPPVRFVDVAKLPLGSIVFDHDIEAAEETGLTRFTHTVTIDGLLTPLFSRVIGRRIAAELPKAMRALARLAEEPDGR